MAIEIRSYRSVFDLERRIYRIDRLRLNPGGIPVRGVVYLIAIVLATLLAARLPLLGAVAGALPWYVRDLALPAAAAALLTVVRIEGRPFHLAAGALLRHATGPRRLAGARPCLEPGRRWYPPDIAILPDGSDSRLRRLRYSGPGAVLVTVAHERAEYGRGPSIVPGRRARLVVRALPGRRALRRGQAIALPSGTRLDVQAEASAGRSTPVGVPPSPGGPAPAHARRGA
jgi:hypothetical protein